ncbi:FAD-binding protein [Streptomyces sp. CRN 30]|uniref:FAD-binding protein n=1 Tax=Streptomyces sp. CRN 30 TaxID=3075613 RepID=UPI002A8251C6|nr:FAD-binding protein [Streptomyces sp. CRN 30]
MTDTSAHSAVRAAPVPPPAAPSPPPGPSADPLPRGAPSRPPRLLVIPLLLAVAGVLWLAHSAYAVCRRVLRRPAAHEQRVARLGATVRRLAGERAGLLCTGTGEWRSAVALRGRSFKSAARPVEFALDAVLELDTEHRVVRVEPGVTMGRLVRHLVRRGWTLPVAPGPDGLTVGGLTMGSGVDSTSHRHGPFADTVVAYEVLLGTGEVVRASAAEHPDLFHALPWSRGSLGFLVAVELRVVPAHAWVEVRYHPVTGLVDLCRDLTRLADTADGPAFVEGFVTGHDEGVVVTGEFADRAKGQRSRVHRWYAPWFPAHARNCARAGGRVEYLPLRHYHRRHRRGPFAAGALLAPFGGHPLFRLPLGWATRSGSAFLGPVLTRRIRHHLRRDVVAQEALVPAQHLEELVRHCRQVYEIDELWVRPVRLTRGGTPGLVGPGPEVGPGQRQLFMDVTVVSGVPGPVRRGEPWDPRDATRRFAAWVGGRKGFQAPYGPSESSRDEYRAMFDCWLYDRVRLAYGAEGVFVDAYDKGVAGRTDA